MRPDSHTAVVPEYWRPALARIKALTPLLYEAEHRHVLAPPAPNPRES